MLENQSKEQLVDQFGRLHSNLRISVTDRCNLRCRYCVVSDKINWIESNKAINAEEIFRLVKVFSELGVNRLRITGGEPLVNPDTCKIISKIKSNISAIEKINMTSNGVLLGKYFDELVASKLDSINISLDTLNADKFHYITKSNNFNEVLQNIKDISSTNIKTKINVVALKNFNDGEIFDFIDLSDLLNVTVRFIEFMPFTGNQWLPSSFISSKDLRDKIEKKYHLEPLSVSHPSQTSRIYEVEGTQARIGFISSVTESFCQWCNRLRITADGNLRNCLHGTSELPLKELLTQETDPELLKTKIINFVYGKHIGHKDFLAPGFEIPLDDREMMRIGG